MNHIGDTNKMVSDTPRMDLALRKAQEDCTESYLLTEGLKLERELNAANELIVRLQAVTNDPHALWANWLRGSVALPVGIGDVRKYEDRIKRLEEAGDDMHISCSDRLARRIWTAAKEAKP